MKEFTLIWQNEALDMHIETCTAATVEEAIENWKADDNADCGLIGVLEGRANVLRWDA